MALGGGGMFSIGTQELVLILVLVLILFGPGKLPEAAKSLGKAWSEFKKAKEGLAHELTDEEEKKDEPTKE